MISAEEIVLGTDAASQSASGTCAHTCSKFRETHVRSMPSSWAARLRCDAKLPFALRISAERNTIGTLGDYAGNDHHGICSNDNKPLHELCRHRLCMAFCSASWAARLSMFVQGLSLQAIQPIQSRAHLLSNTQHLLQPRTQFCTETSYCCHDRSSSSSILESTLRTGWSNGGARDKWWKEFPQNRDMVSHVPSSIDWLKRCSRLPRSLR